MTKLLLLGSPYWCRYLCTHLAREGVDARHIAHRPEDLLRLFFHRKATILAVGFGASLSFKRAIIWLIVLLWWLLHRRKESIVQYWIGSDVARAQEGGVNKAMFDLLSRMGARHICGAPWFVEQLRRAGIDAEPVLFPYDTGEAADHPSTAPEPPPLRALAYLTPGSWQNMNGNRILELAKLAPDIQWDVVGMNDKDLPGQQTPPLNMRFLGWVDDPLAVMASCHVFVRLANHDAYSGMVRDAQTMGKAVLYTKPVEGCINVAGKTTGEIAEILISTISELTYSSDSDAEFRPNLGVLPTFKQQLATLVGALRVGAPN